VQYSLVFPYFLRTKGFEHMSINNAPENRVTFCFLELETTFFPSAMVFLEISLTFLSVKMEREKRVPHIAAGISQGSEYTSKPPI